MTTQFVLKGMSELQSATAEIVQKVDTFEKDLERGSLATNNVSTLINTCNVGLIYYIKNLLLYYYYY